MKKLVIAILILVTAPIAHSQDGSELIDSGKYSEAVEMLSMSLENNANNALNWFNLGIAHYKTQNFPKAEHSFWQCIRLKSPLADAAAYYRALAFLNQNKFDAAVKSAKLISRDSKFYEDSLDLVKAIENREDEALREAKKSYEEYDYESCVEFVNESVFAEHSLGLEIKKKCQSEIDMELKEGAGVDKVEATKKSTKPAWSFDLYADLSAGYNNNVYSSATSPLARGIYSATVGAEYLNSSEFEWGIGASYEAGDVIAESNAKDSLATIHVPLNYYADESEFFFDLYGNQSQAASVNSYSQSGLSSSYYYTWDNISFGLTADLSRKKAQSTTYTYLEGNYSSIRGDVLYVSGDLKLDLYVTADRISTNDQVVTGGTVPYAHTASVLGYSASYWITKSFRITGLGSTTAKNYLNQYANVPREDRVGYLKIKMDFKTSDHLKLYIESLNTTSVSNYNGSQIAGVNYNYKENVVNIGLYINN